jgi:hypothetical protein
MSIVGAPFVSTAVVLVLASLSVMVLSFDV